MALNLEVSLDLAADPPVVISNRKVNARGNKLMWNAEKGGLDFIFWDLQELNTTLFPAQKISKKGKRIRCGNRAPWSEKEYPYVIVVKYEGVEYTSTESGLPPDDKPVIRNQ